MKLKNLSKKIKLNLKVFFPAILLLLVFGYFKISPVKSTATSIITVSLVRQNCSGYSNCYTSLAAWESARQRDLVAANEIEEVKIEGNWTTADTTAVTIDGWTTDATHYIKIYTAPEARHGGKWDDGKYRLVANSGWGGYALKVASNNVQISGLELNFSGGGSAANVVVITGSNVLIDKSIIKGSSGNGISMNGAIGELRNSIVYDNKWDGVHLSSPSQSVKNVTVYNNLVAGVSAYYSGGHTVENVISMGNVGGDFAKAGSNGAFSIINNCYSSDATASIFGGTGHVTSQTTTATFFNEAGKDFHLKEASLAINAGKNLSGFSDDIDNDTRSTPYDIGADEYSGSYIPPTLTCSSFNYSAWSSCQTNNTQTRTITSSSPLSCTGGNPEVLTQSCVYQTIDTTLPITTASPIGGTYSSTQTITLSANETATIYYTTNNSTPTTSSNIYSTPIVINQTITLKFFAKDTAGNIEAVKTENYVISSTPASGNNYYIATNGADWTNDCSLTRPCATMSYAAGKLHPGDTLLIRGGTYTEGEVWFRAVNGFGGSAGQIITIKNYPGEDVYFTNGNRGIIIEASFIRIEGLNFRNGKSISIPSVGFDTIQIVNNTFKDNGTAQYAWDAIETHGNNILVEGNVCEINGNTQGTQGHCYYISHGTNIIIRNNIAKGPTGYGIHVFDQRRSGDAADFNRLIKDIVIEGNIVSNSLQRSGIIISAYDHSTVENVIIRNNIVYNNADNGIYIPGEAHNIKVYNNTVFGNRGSAALFTQNTSAVTGLDIRGNIFDITGIAGKYGFAHHVVNENNNTNVTLNNNLYWPGSAKLYKITDSAGITGDPKFVNATSNDFHSQSDSSAINKGISLAEVTTDKDGISRPQGSAYDIGAYEYKSGTPPPTTCSSFTYSAWSFCQPNNTQTRTVTSSSPNSCTGGTPVLTQSCTYTPPDTTPPTISTPIISLTTTSATITFTTNENTNSYIEYGLTSSYVQQTNTSNNKTSFSFTLSNLSDNTTYNYRLVSTDSSSNTSQSLNFTFKTNQALIPDIIPPSNITNLSATNITQTSVKLNWTAPGDDGSKGIAASYDIRYSTSIINETNWSTATKVNGEPNPSSSGSEDYISVGLSPSTTYYFAIKASDEVNNLSTISNIISFKTLDIPITPPGQGGGGGGGGTPNDTSTDTTPPSQPFSFTTQGADKQISLSWINPKDTDFVRVKILRTETNQNDPSCPTSATDTTAKTIYEGSKAEYADINLDNDKKYCYAIFAYDQKPNYSKISAQIARPEAGKKSTAVEKETVNTNSLNCSLYAKLITLGALSGDESNKAAFCEASAVAGNSQQVELSDQSKKIYEKVSIRANNLSGLNVLNKYSLAYFIHSGTPTTKQLGAGERAGSVMSYYQAFNKLPETENDWSDVIKIANGRWPKEISRQAEDKAKIEFKKIYKREAEMKNPNDNAAVSVIAYGLRPAKRNQNSEKNAINSFKSIYKKAPQSALDWDIVRSIAYSGARR